MLGESHAPYCTICPVSDILLDRWTILDHEKTSQVDGSYHSLNPFIIGSVRNGCMTCPVISILHVEFAHNVIIFRYSVLSPNSLSQLVFGITEELLYTNPDNRVSWIDMFSIVLLQLLAYSTIYQTYSHHLTTPVELVILMRKSLLGYSVFQLIITVLLLVSLSIDVPDIVPVIEYMFSTDPDII